MNNILVKKILKQFINKKCIQKNQKSFINYHILSIIMVNVKVDKNDHLQFILMVDIIILVIKFKLL